MGISLKYFVSFLTTLKVSRYLFRILVSLLWLISAILSVFYVAVALRHEESEIRIAFNINYDHAQRYIQNKSDELRELKYIIENRVTTDNNASSPAPSFDSKNHFSTPTLLPLMPEANCNFMSGNWRQPLQTVVESLHSWHDNFFTAYDINHMFLININDLCMIDFAARDTPAKQEETLNILREQIVKYRNTPQHEPARNIFFMRQNSRPDFGLFYVMTPVLLPNRPHAVLGTEHRVNPKNLLPQGGISAGMTILDSSGHQLLAFTSPATRVKTDPRWLTSHSWFGYSKGFKHIILKKNLPPSGLSIIYSLPIMQVLDRIKMLVFNTLIFNLVLATILFMLARIFEKRLFIPAENDAQRLEEHEQFNRKIVAYAPVGICILRNLDGTNILSNELAHNYLNMLTHEDRQHLTQAVRNQQVNEVSVITSNNAHLQISFVHSRYRHENVAICVLVDVSERVKMEESLQEIAHAADQANQAKSMFLATVSHELRTPLYGIIGNLDLLRTKQLSSSVERLVSTMSNSSSLLLKIISDILDFSKIESEQLKIEPVEFSPREVISHITANYLPLLVRKQLTLYCFIEPGVPASLHGDAMRLQQIMSNLLSNAIKFTDLGCIILRLQREGDYLIFRVRDTGTGIPVKELTRLFEPFFQVANGAQHSFQGTGLGLAICEKLITMMDGDIAVETTPGMGSQFSIRIPLYHACPATVTDLAVLPARGYWLAVRNIALCQFLKNILKTHHISVQHIANPDNGNMAAEHPVIHQQDVLISDEPCASTWPGQIHIRFSPRHIGIPVRHTDGVWIISTAAPHELITLLLRIHNNAEQASNTTSEISTDLSDCQNNEDMLILVVDDHPINRQLLSDQLALLGYQCITAHDGVEALDILEKTTTDMVLTDVNMPNMDGYTLTRHIRQNNNYQTMPVIGITANALAEEKQRCLNAGMDACLSKPVTLALVQQTLAHYASKLRQLRNS